MLTARRALFLVTLQLVAACGGDDGGSSSDFDDTVPDFVDATCDATSMCQGDDRDQCVDDVTSDMADAKAALDAAGQEACAGCMQAKIDAFQTLVARGDCTPTQDELDSIDAACIVSEDGTDDDACAGFP